MNLFRLGLCLRLRFGLNLGFDLGLGLGVKISSRRFSRLSLAFTGKLDLSGFKLSPLGLECLNTSNPSVQCA